MAHAAFCAAHQGARKNWDLPDNFPDTAVIEAYSNPKVDSAKDRCGLVFVLRDSVEVHWSLRCRIAWMRDML